MKEMEGLFIAFYDKFILRDLFAKVTPGAILLLVLSFASISEPQAIYSEIVKLTFWHWIILVPVSWLMGITIQGLGSSIPFIVFNRIKGTKAVNVYDWRRLYYDCDKKITGTSLKSELERIVIIREASGIMFVVIIGSILLLYYNPENYFCKANWVFRIFVIVAAISSLQMNLSMTKAQYDFMKYNSENPPLG